MPTSNKVKYGLKNVHVAEIVEPVDADSGETFGVPKAIPGVVSIALKPSGNTTSFYADNVEYYTAIANNGYDADLEVALIPDWFSIQYLGEIADVKKIQFEDANAKIKRFALLFEFVGDAHGTRHVLYNCKAARPTIEGQTTGENAEVKTEKLTLSARPGSDGYVKAKTTSGTEQTVIDNWYKSVYQYQAQIS